MENKKIIIWDEVNHVLSICESCFEAGFVVNRSSSTVAKYAKGEKKAALIDERFKVFYYTKEKMAEIYNDIENYIHGNNA